MRRLKITFENKAGQRHTFVAPNISKKLTNQELVSLVQYFVENEQLSGNEEFEKIISIKIVEKHTKKLFTGHYHNKKMYYITNNKKIMKN